MSLHLLWIIQATQRLVTDSSTSTITQKYARNVHYIFVYILRPRLELNNPTVDVI